MGGSGTCTLDMRLSLAVVDEIPARSMAGAEKAMNCLREVMMRAGAAMELLWGLAQSRGKFRTGHKREQRPD
jgi:hypothetical protein